MNATERWRDGKVRWVQPDRPVFEPKRFRVERIAETAARAFVERHHYLRSFPAAQACFGLMEDDTLSGVAVFSVPAQAKVLTSVFDVEPYREATELGRLVLLDDVAYNAESWFVARAFAGLAEEGLRGDGVGVRGVVSFSDPVQRIGAGGEVVTPGHVGVVYQALGAAYLGRSSPDTELVLPGGAVLSKRALSKVRADEVGHEYVERLLVAAGARERRAGEDGALWLARALVAAGATRRRHPGKHRYAFALGRSAAERRRVRIVAERLAYPRRQLDLFGAERAA
jgi:hypothetical protein